MDGRWRTGTIRRLTEEFGTGIFGGTLIVPNSNTAESIQNNTASVIESISSYMIYNVFLCYLYGYTPELATESAPIGGGIEVHTHRSPHMCFPALPIALPTFPNFTQLTGVDPNLIENTELQDFCGTMAIDKTFNQTLTSAASTLRLGPVGQKAFRRLFQNPVGATAAVTNLGRAFGATNMTARTVHTACALSRVNALLWTFAFFLVLIGLYLTCFWPCLNIVALWMRFACCCCCRGLLCRKRRRGRRRYNTM